MTSLASPPATPFPPIKRRRSLPEVMLEEQRLCPTARRLPHLHPEAPCVLSGDWCGPTILFGAPVSCSSHAVAGKEVKLSLKLLFIPAPGGVLIPCSSAHTHVQKNQRLDRPAGLGRHLWGRAVLQSASGLGQERRGPRARSYTQVIRPGLVGELGEIGNSFQALLGRL